MQRTSVGEKTSTYNGVGWDKGARRWYSSIMHEMKQHYLGRFVYEIDAAKAYDDRARNLRGTQAHGSIVQNKGQACSTSSDNRVWLNFPTDQERAAALPALSSAEDIESKRTSVAASQVLVAQRLAAGQPTSKFYGVSWAKASKRWIVALNFQAQKKVVGRFVDEDAAALAYDGTARRLRDDQAHGGVWHGKTTWLNFPTSAECETAEFEDDSDNESDSDGTAAAALPNVAPLPNTGAALPAGSRAKRQRKEPERFDGTKIKGSYDKGTQGWEQQAIKTEAVELLAEMPGWL